MNLDEAQKNKVAGWLTEGLKLSDIQKRLADELGVTMTYMEVRFLVDDLRLTPKDVELAKSPELSRTPPDLSSPNAPQSPSSPLAPEPPSGLKSVSVKVDQISRPGTVASGRVTFSDGNSAEWYLDQTGRLGMVPQQQGYRPSQPDVIAFQTELQNELSRIGM